MKLKIPQSAVFVPIHEIEDIDCQKILFYQTLETFIVFFAIRITIIWKVRQAKILFWSSFAVVKNISGI